MKHPEDLLPCPFCGSAACFRRTSEFAKGIRAECANPDCLANVYTFGADEQGAAERWNTRATK